MLGYWHTTTPGTSGGPIILYKQGGKIYLIGIHNGVSRFTKDEDDEELNCGICLTEELFNSFTKPTLKKYYD